MRQLGYLIRLRTLLTWRLYTRHTIASLESLLFFLIFSIWVGGIWIVFSYGARRNFSHSFVIPELAFANVFTLVMLIWLIMAPIGYRLSEGYDINRLRIYPLPLPVIYFANIIGSVLDIGALPALAAFIAVFLAAGPAFFNFLIGLVFIFMFLFFLILAGQTISILLYTLLPKLSTVRIGVILLLGVLAWSIVMGLGGFRNPQSWFNFHIFFVPSGIEVFKPYPGGQMGVMLAAILDSRWSDIWKITAEYRDFTSVHYPLAEFMGWFFGVAGLNYLIHLAWIDSDIKNQVVSPKVGKYDIGPIIMGILRKILIPIFGREAFELYRKDMLEYAFRSPYFLVYKFLPGTIAPVIIVLAMKWNLDPQSGLITNPSARAASLVAMAVMVLFIVIAQAVLFSGNLFGFEDANIRGLMSYPVKRRNILLGKNIFFGGLFLIDAIIVSFLTTVFFPGIFTFFAAFILLMALLLIILALGNFVSSIWPYWMPLDKPSFTLRTTIILGFVNAGFTLASLIAYAPPLAMVVFPILWHNYILAAILMPFALAYGILFHHFTMKPAAGLLESNEFLLLRRIADREQL